MIVKKQDCKRKPVWIKIEASAWAKIRNKAQAARYMIQTPGSLSKSQNPFGETKKITLFCQL
jgi:hypothetical protein